MASMKNEVKLAKLRADLKGIIDSGTQDPEADHSNADALLLEFINDKEVSELYNSMTRWYA
jgi:hypothetical protein